ncbi:hypothetical protein CARUB_v10021969mg [Capsella rubella]|uniref:Knottin scorpion toxin-like domain-containing protein n=1 Tax=Capsella rubella TaxID=81985 RepID=R0I9V5_9BRAS|nr:defensin-like protein 35 [Capsella rubella]EOA33323.1 hypothetical protein CARUB_v10021969mg [Capsella rubella]
MASNKNSFILVLCLCVLLTSELGGEAKSMNPTGRKCPDPNGVDRKSECAIYCTTQGFMGGSCQGYKGHYMCECYEG